MSISPKARHITLLTIRILLGLVFLLSGIGKLIEGSDARYLVELMATEFYWLIEYTAPIVITISIIEIVIACLLLWGRKLRWVLSAALAMVLVFSGILGYFYLQGMSVASCGCFGAFGVGGGMEFTLIRNAVLTILILTAFFLSSSKHRVDLDNHRV